MADSMVWVDEVEPAAAVAVAGSKMGRLAELHRAGVQVPQGFAVTVDAYRRHCAESGLDARIDEVIAGWAPTGGRGGRRGVGADPASCSTPRRCPTR